MLDENSVFRGDVLRLNRIVNPNLRIKGSSLIELDEVLCSEGDVSNIGIDIDESSKWVWRKEEQSNEITEKDAEQSKEPKSSAREQLNQMIGLKSVKKEIDKMLHLAEFNRQRIAKGLQPQEQSFHSVFSEIQEPERRRLRG